MERVHIGFKCLWGYTRILPCEWESTAGRYGPTHKAALPRLSFSLVPMASGSTDNGKMITDIALGIASDGARPQFPFTNSDAKAILAAAPEFQSMHNIHARIVIGRWAREFLVCRCCAARCVCLFLLKLSVSVTAPKLTHEWEWVWIACG